MKRYFKSIMGLVLALAVVLSVCPVRTQAASAIKLNKTKLTMYVGDTYTLKLKKAKGTVTWTSADEDVATVSSKGVVKAVGKGTVKINASCKNKNYKCTVTVKEAGLNYTELNMTVGDPGVTLKLEGGKIDTFESDNEEVASVSGKGVVKAVRGGTATITVTDKKDNEYYVKVTVDEDREAYKMTVIYEDESTLDFDIGRDPIYTGKDIAYVTLGSYPQSQVTGDELTKEILRGKWDDNDDLIVNSVKYHRVKKESKYRNFLGTWEDDGFAYFKYEPIKWRVLDVETKGSNKANLLLLSEDLIDAFPYYEQYVSIPKYSWADSSVRSWLNGYGEDENVRGIDYSEQGQSFSSVAFTSGVMDMLKTDEDGDKVSLPTTSILLDTSYGFSAFERGDEGSYEKSGRMAAFSVYATVDCRGFYSGAKVNGRSSAYYLQKDVDEKYNRLNAVADTGVLTTASGQYQYYAIRPLITVSLSATDEEPETPPATISEEEALLDSILEDAGAGEGKITVSMLWHTNDDMDLHLVTPSDHIYYANKNTASGILDIDRQVTSLVANPIENIYVDDPVSGAYEVYVVNYRDRTPLDATTKVIVRVTIDGESQLFNVDVADRLSILKFNY